MCVCVCVCDLSSLGIEPRLLSVKVQSPNQKTAREFLVIISFMALKHFVGFPDRSVGKEFACKTGDPSLISGLGRSSGEGIGYPVQYSWTSLVAQLVKNLLSMQETWVRSLDWKDPLEKGNAAHSSILAWRIPWTV